MKISLLFDNGTYCWIAYNTLGDACSLPYHICRMKISANGKFETDNIELFDEFTSYAARAEEIHDWIRKITPRKVVEPEILRGRINSIK